MKRFYILEGKLGMSDSYSMIGSYESSAELRRAKQEYDYVQLSGDLYADSNIIDVIFYNEDSGFYVATIEDRKYFAKSIAELYGIIKPILYPEEADDVDYDDYDDYYPLAQ